MNGDDKREGAAVFNFLFIYIAYISGSLLFPFVLFLLLFSFKIRETITTGPSTFTLEQLV